jgi:hypothetical protein
MTILLTAPIEREIVNTDGKAVGLYKSFMPALSYRNGAPMAIQDAVKILARAPSDNGIPETNLNQRLRIAGMWRIQKFDDEATYEAFLAGDREASPFEVVDTLNGFLTTGITELWNIFIGAVTTPASGSRLQIGIGDSSTAFAASQTGLLATTNIYYQTVDSGYPTVAGAVLTAQASIGMTNAIFTWNEMGIKNSTTGTTYDRVVANQGTKAGTNVWTAQVAITAS